MFGEPSFVNRLDPSKTEKKSFIIDADGLELANKLQQKRVAKECAKWIERKVDIKTIKQSNLLHGKMDHVATAGVAEAILGSSNFTVRGLGLGNVNNNIELNLIVDSNRDRQDLKRWFDDLWNRPDLVRDVKQEVLQYLQQLYDNNAPEFIYYKTLFHIFEKFLEDTGKTDTELGQTSLFETDIWQALFEFQKDGVKGAINKILRHNGCIIADSVGLGKTYEALAVIKYFELKNERVLVLCPKKLWENWAVYKANSRRNPFLADRFRYDVLVKYFPSQQASIDAAYDAALAEIPDGQEKTAGISVGEQTATALIALRADDGRFADVPAPPDGDEPGEWRRRSSGSPVTPWTAHVTPFLVHSPEQFRPAGPHPLTSADYAEQFEETRLYGAKTGSLRSPAQTETAIFWMENTVRPYNRALRGLAAERELSVVEAARLFAMTSLTAADAVITCWNTKYHYLGWRPVTAIREAGTDGNPATIPDPTWEPFSVMANHPEYTSGHACLTGAITRSLEEFLGTEDIDLTMDSTATGTGVHYFATVDDLRTADEDHLVI